MFVFKVQSLLGRNANKKPIGDVGSYGLVASYFSFLKGTLLQEIIDPNRCCKVAQWDVTCPVSSCWLVLGTHCHL